MGEKCLIVFGKIFFQDFLKYLYNKLVLLNKMLIKYFQVVLRKKKVQNIENLCKI